MEGKSEDKMCWLGHAGVRFSIHDKEGKKHTLYIDPWFQNPKIPESEKEPKECDVVLVTHGHFDHITGAKDILKAQPKAKAVCIFEVGGYLKKNGATGEQVIEMNKGGTLDLGWVKVIMTEAIHSGSCPGEENCFVPGGSAAGFVIQFNGYSIYHAGDTNVFTDMGIIDELYKPQVSLLPIGGHFTMAPKEAAYALKKFLPHTKFCHPIHFKTFIPPLSGDIPELKIELAK